MFYIVLPAPSAPVINPQIPNSATQTSLRVCWSLFSDDTVDYYELYYRPVLEDVPADGTQMPQGHASSFCLATPERLSTDVISEGHCFFFYSVSKVKVKETHCTVTDLLPNAQYELWVTATNTTGISPASEKALYTTGKTAPGECSWAVSGCLPELNKSCSWLLLDV